MKNSEKPTDGIMKYCEGVGILKELDPVAVKNTYCSYKDLEDKINAAREYTLGIPRTSMSPHSWSALGTNGDPGENIANGIDASFVHLARGLGRVTADAIAKGLPEKWECDPQDFAGRLMMSCVECYQEERGLNHLPPAVKLR